MTKQIHNLANVNPSAKIAEGVTIDAFATVYGDVEIGEGSWIGPNAVIADGARIGKNVKIFPGAVISTAPQDLKYKGEITTVEIGENTIVREFATINKGTEHSWKTVVGKNVLVMAYAHIAHDCVVSDHAILANAVNLGGHVLIDEYAIIGGMCAIHQFCRVGRHAIMAGGTMLGKDIPPFAKCGRMPASYLGVNTVGMKRRGFVQDDIHTIQEIYRILFLKGLNFSNAVSSIESTLPESVLKTELLDFFKSSGRGLIKPKLNGEDDED